MQTELAMVDGHPIEYRRAGTDPGSRSSCTAATCRRPAASVRETYLDAGLGVLTVSRPGYGRTAAAAGPSAPEFVPRLARLLEEQ